jgi:hypothetical protein
MNEYRRRYAIVVIAALALRIAMIFTFQTYKGDPGAYEHDYIAAALARGEGFVFNFFSDQPLPSSHQAPAMPLLLSLCFRVAGVGTPNAYLLMELFQAGLAMVGLWAIARIGAMLWSEKVGLVAAWGFALYPPLLYAVTRVQAVNWTVSFLPLSVYCLLRLRADLSIWMAVVTGVCLAVGALGEPVLQAPTLAALVLVSAWRELRLALVVAVAMVLSLLPWAVRNTLVHGRPVAIKSTFWYVFWQGNNLRASGTDKMEVSPEIARALSWRLSLGGLEAEMTEARHQAVNIDSVIPTQELARIRAQPREIDKMEWFKQESIRTVRAHPAHYLRMCLKRAFQLAWFDTTNPRSFALAYRLPYIVLLLMASVGVVASMPNPPRQWPVPVTMAAALAMVHVLVITSARFRLPLEGMMLLPAGYGLVWVTSRSCKSRICGSPVKLVGIRFAHSDG